MIFIEAARVNISRLCANISKCLFTSYTINDVTKKYANEVYSGGMLNKWHVIRKLYVRGSTSLVFLGLSNCFLEILNDETAVAKKWTLYQNNMMCRIKFQLYYDVIWFIFGIFVINGMLTNEHLRRTKFKTHRPLILSQE